MQNVYGCNIINKCEFLCEKREKCIDKIPLKCYTNLDKKKGEQ